MAEPIIPKRRIITEKDNLIEIVAWKVPKSKFYPEGIKYSFTFVHEDKRAVAFDNFNNEGHHKHYFGKKETYKFKSLDETSDKFFRLVEKFEHGD
ncbi:MAG: DUF6516 family protein [Nanoarchaeota archaeon]